MLHCCIGMSMNKRLRSLNPYELHKALLNEYVFTSSNSTSCFQRDTSKDKRDIDVIRENHQFLWDEETSDVSWEKKLARKYYNKLFKEYCVGDLSRYKENKIGLRWRTEKEVIAGKGQFICGCKTCIQKNDLRSWEVNFGYVENGIKKNALVKLRLCPSCSKKLNYHHTKKEVKRLKQNQMKPKGNKINICEKSKSGEGVSNSPIDLEKNESQIWEQSIGEKEEEEKSREQEFDEYLCQLLL